MELLKIGEKDYGYAVDFKRNKQLRSSFNRLTHKTFGFDFEEWYHHGYWKEHYIPHALLDGDEVVANVSVSVIDFFVLGEKKRGAQIGTVMTDDGYRNLGLSRYLMERVLEEWRNKCDSIYLFANDSVLNFYPKFGFVRVDEYQHTKEISGEKVTSVPEKLDMLNDENRTFLKNRINQSTLLSKFGMSANDSLIMFYYTSFIMEDVYHLETLNTTVIAEYDNETLCIKEIFSEEEVHLDDVVKAMSNEEVKKVVMGFTPRDTTSFDVNLKRTGDSLFIWNDKEDLIANRQMMFPVLSHA